jgi:hypothetical protein
MGESKLEQAKAPIGARPAPPEQPALWRRVVQALSRFGRRVGELQAALLLSVFYFLVVGPHALVVRLFTDSLRVGTADATGWMERRRPEQKTLAEIRRQS